MTEHNGDFVGDELVQSRIGAGARSVEVNVYNQVPASLRITSATKLQGNSWIAGEEPVVGNSLTQGRIQQWGVGSKADDSIRVEGTVILRGYGNGDITIKFWNTADSESDVTIDGNNLVVGEKSGPITDGDDKYVSFDVVLKKK